MTLSGFRHRFVQNAMDTAHPFASLARWPSWLLACASGRPKLAHFKTGRLKMQLVPKLHSFGSTSIFIKRDYYEPELLAVGRLIEPGSLVLDIGGSFGIFALFMSHFSDPDGWIHCFEPDRFSFSQLNANVALNRMEQRIILHHAAASDRLAMLQLFHVGDSPVNFSLGGEGDMTTEEVPALRIADMVPAEDAARVNFIEIDVEGNEIAALEGAPPIIEASRPVVMFEVSASALARQGLAPLDVYTYLAGFGYRFWMLEGTGMMPVEGAPDGNIFAAIADLAQHYAE